MDTIIYLSLERSGNARGLKRSPVLSIRERSGKYLLLNIGIPKELLEYTGEVMGEKEPVEKGTGWKEQFIRRMPCSMAEYFNRKHLIKKQQIKVFDYRQRLGNVLAGVKMQLDPGLEESHNCFTVFDESMEKWLGRQDQDCQKVWNQLWPFPMLEDYREEWFIEELLCECHLAHFIVLGFDYCLPSLLIRQARHMKSLRMYVDELSEKKQEFLDEFLDEFYEEYGLAAGVHVMENKTSIVCTLPSAILDFSHVEKILAADVAKGSIWLDMDSMEGKRRRLEERNTGIRYYSMKKLWKIAAVNSKER